MYLLSPLSGVTLREAIEQPAIHAGYQLERGLVDLVVRDAEGEPGALPMLSHALAETWRGREGVVMTLEGYRRTGEMRGRSPDPPTSCTTACPPGGERSCVACCCDWSHCRPTALPSGAG